MISISRHYRMDHLEAGNLETKILIYEDQVRGWFLDQACILEKASDHAGFVTLLIVLSFIEGHAIFLKGKDSKNHSSEFFKYAFNKIFPLPDKDPEVKKKALAELYDQMRCGMFHTGITRGKVFLSGDPEKVIEFYYVPETKEITQITVVPHAMFLQVEDYFSKYMMRLRNPDETKLRENFEKAWELRGVIKRTSP